MNIIIKNHETNAIDFFPFHNQKFNHPNDEIEAWQRHNNGVAISWQITRNSLVDCMTDGTIARL